MPVEPRVAWKVSLVPRVAEPVWAALRVAERVPTETRTAEWVPAEPRPTGLRVAEKASLVPRVADERLAAGLRQAERVPMALVPVLGQAAEAQPPVALPVVRTARVE
jgi:hypothetical protein